MSLKYVCTHLLNRYLILARQNFYMQNRISICPIRVSHHCILCPVWHRFFFLQSSENCHHIQQIYNKLLFLPKENSFHHSSKPNCLLAIHNFICTTYWWWSTHIRSRILLNFSIGIGTVHRISICIQQYLGSP